MASHTSGRPDRNATTTEAELRQLLLRGMLYGAYEVGERSKNRGKALNLWLDDPADDNDLEADINQAIVDVLRKYEYDVGGYIAEEMQVLDIVDLSSTDYRMTYDKAPLSQSRFVAERGEGGPPRKRTFDIEFAVHAPGKPTRHRSPPLTKRDRAIMQVEQAVMNLKATKGRYEIKGDETDLYDQVPGSPEVVCIMQVPDDTLMVTLADPQTDERYGPFSASQWRSIARKAKAAGNSAATTWAAAKAGITPDADIPDDAGIPDDESPVHTPH